jgi:hypothetical protein
MRCHFRNIVWIMIALLAGYVISGCVSLRIEKINNGADILPPPEGFMAGKTSLQEVLLYYGAPTEVIDMQGYLALHYQRKFYRGGHVSVGIPLGDVYYPSPKMDARGALALHDAIVFIFTTDGLLKDMRYEKSTSRPLWDTYWE